MVYEAICVQGIISIGLCLYFFNTEILAPLEVFKKQFILPHFDYTFKFEILPCKNEDFGCTLYGFLTS